MQSTLEPVENNLVTVMPEQTPNPWDPAIPPETVEETITCYVPNDVGNARRF